MTKKGFAVKDYTEQDLSLAITDVINGKSLRKAVKDHNIPFGTFHRYYNSSETSLKRAGAKPVLTTDEELPIVSWQDHL